MNELPFSASSVIKSLLDGESSIESREWELRQQDTSECWAHPTKARRFHPWLWQIQWRSTCWSWSHIEYHMGITHGITWKHGNKLYEKVWNSPNAKPSLWISMVWSPVPALEELFNQLWCIREILGTRCCVGSSTSLRHAANLPKRCTVWDFDIFEVSNNAGTITDMMTWCIQLHALLLCFSAIWCPTCQVQPWYYASRTTELKGSIPWTSTTELQGQIQLKTESVLSLSDS